MGNCVSAPSSSSSPSDIPPPRRPALSTDGSSNPSPSSSSQGPQTPKKGKGRALSHRSGLSTSSMMASHPLLALRHYATLSNPQTSLPANKLLFANYNTMAVFDAYPKAKYHFLVLPRYPFSSQSDPDGDESIVPLEALDDLKSLLLKGGVYGREEVLRAMEETAREVEEMIRDEMLKTEGFAWRVDVGFHAVPSMKHVHLHVISDDRISPSLKSKKHYNSFRPDLGFFIPIMEVRRWLQNEQTLQERVDALAATTSLLKTPLTCFKCDEPMNNIEKLKTHFEKEFSKERKAALRYIARHGHQKGSDDDIF
ncbi:hypothetical protein L202_00116 [Cryptococcus amylolentus CBS 6039]|uniref:Uncharacterized protein n=2 Tax=Cryptococcus amylolentus TaxID=104669 RepID=A0A1E3I6C0_9TREE|nr:hypothetical protein L202_00116 [Cryptococcus amylolentus CBS 6039]ODN84102.1 hypothetical protein L202_00116 [Cryptococcus amylolentus CBS 6039]ODO12030.1 hypothetical protein I350_00814 [Cryptococcus amylolentus CBS 6273]